MRITRDDAFRILGVNEDSSPDEIRSCYKKLALKWHPDKHGDSNVSKDEATLKFQEVSAAYKRLTTNMNDADDEIDDNEFMNIREMMELFAHIFFHNGVRGCPHHGMDCCDYEDDEYFYSDDEYYDYTDEESEDELLDSIAQRLRNKYEQRKYKPKDRMQTQRHNITEEEALRNARELIEEEEQEKEREEKKKAKRKKKKEKKKQKEKEKKETEINTTTEKDEEILTKKLNKENSNPNNQKKNISDEKPTVVNQKQQQQQQIPKSNKQDNNTSGKKSKGNENSNKKNPKNKQDSGKKDTKNKNNKNTEGDHDEDLIDTNSAFFARAASKAPTVSNEVTSHQHQKENTSSSSNNNKKKKGGANSGGSGTTNHSQQPQTQQPLHNNHTTENNNSKKKKVPPPLSTTSTSSSTSNTTTNNQKNTSTSKNTTSQKSHISPRNSEPSSQKSPPLTNGDHKPDDIILQSRQVAVQGNQLAQQNDYTGAVEMFTKAISLDPTDFRFFGNRSYCFDRLENYTKALVDSDAAIKLAPEWPKGFFRKGRALTGLNRFQEAEQVFQQVLKLDPGCEDAQFELARVRVQILIDMGFTPSLSEQAVRTYSTVQQALEALLAGKVSDEEGSDEVYFSEDDEPPASPTYHTVQNNNKKSNNKQPKAPPQPKCTALWVGNVDPQLVTEKQMSQLFGKCGKVSSVRILPHKYCAFVNYMDPKSAVAAMEKLQGAAFGNQKLLLRFPNNPPPGSIVPEPLSVNTKTSASSATHQAKTSPSISESSNDSSKASGPVNGNECYFWRTTGCVFENQCRYKHVRGHKGVDLSKVQAKYGTKLSS